MKCRDMIYLVDSGLDNLQKREALIYTQSRKIMYPYIYGSHPRPAIN